MEKFHRPTSAVSSCCFSRTPFFFGRANWASSSAPKASARNFTIYTTHSRLPVEFRDEKSKPEHGTCFRYLRSTEGNHATPVPAAIRRRQHFLIVSHISVEQENMHNQNKTGLFKKQSRAARRSTSQVYIQSKMSDSSLNPQEPDAKEDLFWRTVVSLEEAIPDEISVTAKDLPIVTGVQEVQVNSAEGKLYDAEVFYRECFPAVEPKFAILLLHGHSFTSSNWVEIGTLQLLAAMGYCATAIDLPEYGKTSGRKFEKADACAFMQALFRTRGMYKSRNLVIISPSMSGEYSLPYVMTHTGDSTALIAVAPVKTGSYAKSDYEKLKIPVLHVRGERDLTLGKQAENSFNQAPQARTIVLKNAGHAAYMDQPDEWHRILYNFLKQLEMWFKSHDPFDNYSHTENDDIGNADLSRNNLVTSEKQEPATGENKVAEV